MKDNNENKFKNLFSKAAKFIKEKGGIKDEDIDKIKQISKDVINKTSDFIKEKTGKIEDEKNETIDDSKKADQDSTINVKKSEKNNDSLNPVDKKNEQIEDNEEKNKQLNRAKSVSSLNVEKESEIKKDNVNNNIQDENIKNNQSIKQGIKEKLIFTDSNKKLIKNIFSNDTKEKGKKTVLKIFSYLFKFLFVFFMSFSFALFICSLVDKVYEVNRGNIVLAWVFLIFSICFLILSYLFKRLSDAAYLRALKYKNNYKNINKLIKEIRKNPHLKMRFPDINKELLSYKKQMKRIYKGLFKLFKSIDYPSFDLYIVERRLLIEEKMFIKSKKKLKYLNGQYEKITLFHDFLDKLSEEIESVQDTVNQLWVNRFRLNSINKDQVLSSISGFYSRLIIIRNEFINNVDNLNEKKINRFKVKNNIFIQFKKFLSPKYKFGTRRISISAILTCLFSINLLFHVILGILIIITIVFGVYLSLSALPVLPYMLGMMAPALSGIFQLIFLLIKFIIGLINLYFFVFHFLLIGTIILSLISKFLIRQSAGLVIGIPIANFGIKLFTFSLGVLWILFLLLLILGYTIFSTVMSL